MDSPSSLINLFGTQAPDSRSQVAVRQLRHKGSCAGRERSFSDLRIVHRREHDHFHLWMRLHDLTTQVQSLGVREVDVEHHHVRLESLRCL